MPLANARRYQIWTERSIGYQRCETLRVMKECYATSQSVVFDNSHGFSAWATESSVAAHLTFPCSGYQHLQVPLLLRCKASSDCKHTQLAHCTESKNFPETSLLTSLPLQISKRKFQSFQPDRDFRIGCVTWHLPLRTPFFPFLFDYVYHAISPQSPPSSSAQRPNLLVVVTLRPLLSMSRAGGNSQSGPMAGPVLHCGCSRRRLGPLVLITTMSPGRLPSILPCSCYFD